MSNLLDWKQDPVVLFEQSVLPVIWHAYRLIYELEKAPDGTAPTGDVVLFDQAESMLKSGALAMLHARDLRPDPRELTPLGDAAQTLSDLRANLARGLCAQQALAYVDDKITPSFNKALDAYRAIFITHVLRKQALHDQQARAAITGLDRISKQIFFISINASVEAARVGDAGRGFLQISTDIRALSQSAQAATRDLSDIVGPP